MSKTTSIILSILIISGASYFAFGGFNRTDTPKDNSSNQVLKNSEIKDGVQYITITAKGGYTPRVSVATSGIPTKLIIKTNSTYDCSAALVINSLNFRKMLTNTGETIVDAGTPKSGDVIQGICAMGMYNFSIKFN